MIYLTYSLNSITINELCRVSRIDTYHKLINNDTYMLLLLLSRHRYYYYF